MSDDIVTRLRENAEWLLTIKEKEESYDCIEAADEVERLRKQRNDLAWAIAWFLNGGSRDKLEQRFKDYEATL